MEFAGVGWKSKVMKKRETYSISINKQVAIGTGVEKGKTLYSYLAHINKRPAIITFLDGEK